MPLHRFFPRRYKKLANWISVHRLLTTYIFLTIYPFWIFLDPCEAGDLYKSYSICQSVRSFVLISLSKLVWKSSPKPLNGLISHFQGMFPENPSCASSHYFSNMSVLLSVNKLSISLSYFRWKNLIGLSSYFQGMFPQTPSYASSHYFLNMSIRLSYFH